VNLPANLHEVAGAKPAFPRVFRVRIEGVDPDRKSVKGSGAVHRGFSESCESMTPARGRSADARCIATPISIHNLAPRISAYGDVPEPQWISGEKELREAAKAETGMQWPDLPKANFEWEVLGNPNRYPRSSSVMLSVTFQSL